MAGTSRWCPDRGDMSWIDCNPQAGREMRDVHPLVVLSGREFNQRTGIVIGLPMTTAAYTDTNPFAVQFAGTKGKRSDILSHQPKSLDWRARKARPHPLRRVPAQAYAQACEGLNQIINLAG